MSHNKSVSQLETGEVESTNKLAKERQMLAIGNYTYKRLEQI